MKQKTILEGRPKEHLIKIIEINAPLAKVWDSLTRPELIQQWLSSEPIQISSDWTVGSSIIFKGDLHGMSFENHGEILQFEPQSRLQFTFWSSLLRHAEEAKNYSVITFELTSNKSSTKLTLMQDNVPGENALLQSNFYWGATLPILKLVNES